MSDTTATQAQKAANALSKKIDDTLNALDCEIKLMGWPPEHRAVIWHGIAKSALARKIFCE